MVDFRSSGWSGSSSGSYSGSGGAFSRPGTGQWSPGALSRAPANTSQTVASPTSNPYPYVTIGGQSGQLVPAQSLIGNFDMSPAFAAKAAGLLPQDYAANYPAQPAAPTLSFVPSNVSNPFQPNYAGQAMPNPLANFGNPQNPLNTTGTGMPASPEQQLPKEWAPPGSAGDTGLLGMMGLGNVSNAVRDRIMMDFGLSQEPGMMRLESAGLGGGIIKSALKTGVGLVTENTVKSGGVKALSIVKSFITKIFTKEEVIQNLYEPKTLTKKVIQTAGNTADDVIGRTTQRVVTRIDPVTKMPAINPKTGKPFATVASEIVEDVAADTARKAAINTAVEESIPAMTETFKQTRTSKLAVGSVIAGIGTVALITGYLIKDALSGQATGTRDVKEEAGQMMIMGARDMLNAGDYVSYAAFSGMARQALNDTVKAIPAGGSVMQSTEKFAGYANFYLDMMDTHAAQMQEMQDEGMSPEQTPDYWLQYHTRVQDMMTAQEAQRVDYFNSQKVMVERMLMAEEEASSARQTQAWEASKARDRAAQAAASEQSAQFWLDYRKKLLEMEAEERERAAAFWLEYRKMILKLQEESRGSSLNFGLLR